MDNSTGKDSRSHYGRIATLLLLAFFLCAFTLSAFSSNRIVNLVVGYKTVNFAGKTREAIAANGQIPAPTLHFKQGDHVTINVYNHLDKGTAIHWHGILVPWQMDGVDGVSQKSIPPGGVFHYKFTLYQSGTYWYHAHKGAQEQEGLYGAFLIDPPHSSIYQYSKDYVVVLSDWSNLTGKKIFANLKKDGDYFSPDFPLQPSLVRFIHDYRKATPQGRKKLLSAYLMMQKMRMSIYDISDVAYDAFLLNGRAKAHPWTALVQVGDVVRLRFIGASASTIYQVKIPGTVMKLVNVDGNDVKPSIIHHFIIGPGETYDVLVKIKKHAPYIIYAESSDTLGSAEGALLTHPHQQVDFKNVTPFPEPEPITMGHGDMSEGDHGAHSMSMHSRHHPVMPMKQERKSLTKGTKYQDLVAAVKTNNPHKPIAKVIHMQLSGWMHHYIWFIDGLPEYKAKLILIKPNRRYRLIFTNITMMKHPMHIHGHWFILRNGHGEYDPLLHTILVSPGATVVADFDSDASGQWFFHCHHMYHMMAGMARVFQYNTIIEIEKGKMKPQSFIGHTPYINRPIVREDETMPIVPALIEHPIGHPAGLYMASFLDVGEDPFHNVQQFTFKGLYGSDYHKLELYTKDAEINKGKIENADMDIFYWHPISQFWAIKGGVNYFHRPAKDPYWQPGVGIEGLMPFFIDTDARVYYYSGSVKFDLELSRDTQITNNFFIRLGIRSILATKTVSRAEIGSGLNQMRYTVRPYYRVAPGVNIFFQYEHEQAYGAFKRFLLEDSEPGGEDITTFGIALVF